MSSNQCVTVDVREDVQKGREPFSKIMMAVSRLEDEQDLVLIAPFEPVPLYSVLGSRGFTHEAKALPGGDWEVRFTTLIPEPRAEESQAGAGKESGSQVKAAPGTEFVDVDARGLEPPQPLVTVLEALESMTKGQILRAHTDRRPMHLYSQLEERGFSWETKEQPDGSFITCAHANS